MELQMCFVAWLFREMTLYNVQPCIKEPCPNYTSKMPAKYVLEVNAGFAMKNEIKIGDLVILHSKI